MKKSIIDIISEYESLKKGLKYIIQHNVSNTAPYHNLNHMLTVTKYCYYALDYMKLLNEPYAEELLLAALFHDFNHSMGKNTDDMNIIAAKTGIEKFLYENNMTYLKLNAIHDIINATQYPYIIKPNELNIHQAIIRDADLCQILEYDWIQHIIFGLSIELALEVPKLIEGEVKFLESIKFITPYGKHIRKTKFKDKLKEFYKFKEIMDNA